MRWPLSATRNSPSCHASVLNLPSGCCCECVLPTICGHRKGRCQKSGCLKTSGNRRRILLADDHPLVLERVTRFLQPTFDVVGVAHNGLEMVLEAMRLSPDVVVADISMPGLDGLAAARQLREMGSGATIVFLTIHESPELVEACLTEGALGFVLKSHMKTDLIPAINVALSGRRFVSSPRHTKSQGSP